MTSAHESDSPDFEVPWQMLLVQQLSADLAGGKLELPSFPEVVVRVREVLADPKADIEGVARVISSEPALAARLLRLANSAGLNPSRKPITDLRTAIVRMGANLVRTSSISFAISQLKRSEACAPVAAQIKAVWQQSTMVAAVAHSVAVRAQYRAPDEALLAGLLHAIGKLYILTRAVGHRAIMDNPGALEEIMQGWHANIGKAILESWKVPAAISDALAAQDEFDDEARGAIGLGELLAVSVRLAGHMARRAGLAETISECRAFVRCGITVENAEAILAASRAEIKELQSALAA